MMPFAAMRLRNESAPPVSFKNFEMLFEGANGSTTFTETFGKTISRTGSVVISTAQFNEGTSSGYFPGGTDYLSTSSSTDFDFGSGDFAIEADIRPDTISNIHMIVTTRATSGSDPGFLLWQNASTVRFICWGPTAGTMMIDINSPSGALAANTWARVRVQRVGTAFDMLIDGVSVASASSSDAIAVSTESLNIGRDPSNSGRHFGGYMDRLRFFKGGIS